MKTLIFLQFGPFSEDASPLFAILTAGIVVYLIALIPYIFFILTLQNTLMKVSSHNRRMNPSEVWLLLIPIFNWVWKFIVVNRIGDSLQAEFRQRNWPLTETRPGVDMGITYCVLSLCGIIPFLGPLCALVGFVFWIIYWVKINDYKEKLMVPFQRPNPQSVAPDNGNAGSSSVDEEKIDWYKD